MPRLIVCVYLLQIEVPCDYENNEPPTVFCETDIYHPNIDTTDIEYETSGSNVCLNLLDRGTWNHKLGLEGAVMGLVFLLHNPNLEDPLTPDFDSVADLGDFEENVKRYMRGEEVDGRCFSADFLKHLQPDANSDSDNAAHDNTAELAHTNTNTEVLLLDVDNENTDGSHTCIITVDQNVSGGQNDQGNIVDETKTGEPTDAHNSSVDCGEITAHSANDCITSSTEVNASKSNDAETDDNSIHVTGDMNIEEMVLSQIEKMGIMEETCPDDNLDECTMITIGDEIMLVSLDAAQCLQENENKVDTEETVAMTSAADEHKDDLSCVDQNKSLIMANASNSEEEEDDSFSAVHSIIDEVVENVINKSAEEDEHCPPGPVINILTVEENNETTSKALFSDENITDNDDNCCATGTDPQTVICTELLVRKPNFTRQKSREYMRNRGHFFQTCAPYLKCILYHTFSCLAKL